MSSPQGLVARFQGSLRASDGPERGDKVLVAISGGLDSCVLLHLVRFHAPEPLVVIAAHYDHALRPESAEDALWVRGLCQAWSVPLRAERAATPPASEAEARAFRYDFLERMRREESGRLVLLGHHADDQAETVLFRILRGTGIEGLAAIPRARGPALLRPLLDVWRAELEAYARSARLGWREDASNDELGYARNAIRHRLLPEAERLVAPGARRALVRLARLAAASEAAWDRELAEILAQITRDDDEGRILIDREALVGLGEERMGRVLRRLARRFELTLDEAATGRAVAFARSGRSGSAIELGGSVELRGSLDRLLLGPRRVPPDPDRPVVIADAAPGRDEAVLGGARIQVAWGGEEVAERAHRECFRLGSGRFPLQVRGRAPGDRIRLSGGTRTLKKVFLEAGIPLERRTRVPVLVDAAGRVLWIPGVARSTEAGEGGDGGTRLRIGVG